MGHTDLYSVQYNNKAGGAATAVPGGSSSSLEEYYPAFAPDDSMLAFTAVQAGQVMYANPIAELYVTPFATPSGLSGAQAIRLNANDPPKLHRPLEPRHQQPLAQVVADRRKRQQQDLLLDDLLVEPVQPARR